MELSLLIQLITCHGESTDTNFKYIWLIDLKGTFKKLLLKEIVFEHKLKYVFLSLKFGSYLF